MISGNRGVVLTLFLLVGTSIISSCSAASKIQTRTITLTRELLNMCKGQETIRDEKHLKWLVAASGENSLLLKTSPQHQAACWVLFADKKSKGRSQKSFLQRYALAVLHFASTKSNTVQWDWPMAVDQPDAITNNGKWMDPKIHECQWYGVRCHRMNGIVYELDLGYMKLDGLVPRELSLLVDLKDLDLHANDFQGVVPHKIVDQLTKLEYLRLHMNGFFGAIHAEIVGMKNLKELNLFGNYFGGTIPKELAQLTKLELIDLYANQFSGTLPSELGKLKKLRFLDAHDNNLVGSVPKEICKLKLKDLIVDCLGPRPEVQCDCCTVCCRGLPDFKCVDQKTGQDIRLGSKKTP